MKTIGEYRARYPQLRELTDYQLTRAVYDTTAPDMPLEDFAKAFGGVTEEDPEEVRIQEYNLSHPDDTIRREDMGKASLLSDTGHGIVAGINELVAIPFWLAEEAGIEPAGRAKDYFLKSAEEKRKGYSPEMKLARAEEFFTKEPDGSYGFGGAWTSPRKILGSVAESAPGMVGGMGLSALAARGLMKAGFSRGLAWAVGSSLGEGTIGGAQNALDVHEAILAMPEDKLAASPEYQEILQRTGDPKRAREELANSVAAMTGLKTGASTAVLSAPSGYMFGKILGGETGKTLLGTAAKQGAAEFGEEAGQSGAEQYLSQAELQRADPTIDPMSGVGEAAVSGGFAGMAMGGGMGGFGHVLGGRAQQQPGAPAVSDAQPVLPPEQQAALPEGGHGSPLELGPGQNIVMGTDRAYEDPIATPPPTSPLQKGMEAILGGPLGLSTAPAAPDFAVTPGGRAVSANGIVQPDAFGPIAAGMRSDMPPLLADQVYDVEYSVVPGAPKALSEAPRGLPLGQDKSPVAPESPQPFDAQANGGSAPLQLTRINDKSFMLHGDTGPFEEAIKAAGGRLDRKVGGWRFPLAREGEIRELFGIPLGAETVPGDNLVSEVPEASPEVLRETPLPVSGDMAMSGQTGLEVTHGGLQQGTPGTGTGELLSESVPVDAAGNPGELDAVTGRPGDFPMGDRGSRPDMDTAVPGAGGTEAGLGAVVQRAAGPVEIPAEGVDAALLSPDRRNVPDGGAGRHAEGGRRGTVFRGHGQVGRDVPGGSERTERAALEGNGAQGVEQKLLRAIERQNGGLTPEAEAWARSLPSARQEAAWQQLTLDAFKGYTASNLRVDEASLKFIPLSKDTKTSLQLKALANVFGQDLILFRDASKQPTGILGATIPAINNVIFMEENREGYRPHLSVLGHEMLHSLHNSSFKLYSDFRKYLLSELKPEALQHYREDLDRRTGHDGTVGRMSDDKILEEIGADLVGKRLTEESFWAKMAEERPSLFARVSQFVRDLLDRVTAAFRADPLPAAWVKDFDAIRRHIDAMMGQWAEKNARAKTGGTPPHSGNTREVLDGRDETVRNAGRNGGEGSEHAGGLLQSNRGRHGAPVDLVGDGGRGGDRGRAAQPAPEGREGERPRQPVAVKIPNRADEPAHYELLEADDVRASHLPSRGFQKNPAYGLENERRYHDEPGSRAKVMENAARLDPAFLMESVDANHGAPVIDHDNNVLGGNGRAMSIARAYESFPERGEQYREALKANADRLGIDPAQVDAMHSPMLVRRLERGMSREERQQLVTAMNDDFKDAKEKRASGKSRGERFGRRTLDMLSAGLKDAESLREYFDTPASVAVVERMMEDGVIQRSERNALVGADGLLNPDGKKVVEEALRGRIARSYEALAKLPADVVGKLDAVIPHILVAEGIGKPWNITEHVRDSVDLLVGFKGSGVKEPGTYLKQVNMLTGRAPVQDFSKQAIALFRMALDAKKGEYVKAFESYLKNAKLSPEAGNIPGVAKPQDKAFRDAFGMKTEAMPNKPEKAEEGKPEAKEQAVPEVRESRTTRKQDASPVQMSDVYQEGGIEDLLPGKILLNYHGKRTSPVPVGKKNISSWLRKEAEKAVAADSEMLAAVRNGNKNGDGFYMGIIAGEHLQEDFRETFELPEMQNPLASLSRWPERRPDNTQVQVVEVEPGIVPEFKKARDLAKWLKEYFSDKREETILSTGKKVRFGNSNLEASIKRARENTHNQAYAGLNELVRRAEFDSFEAKDARHPNLGGQEVYYSAFRIGDTLYAVKFKMDIPSEAELTVRRDWRGEKDIEDLRYKDHALREIEIAPVLYRGVVPNNGVPTQATEAIRRINLGVLRDAVKPSRLENGVLSSVKPGEFLNDAPSSGPRILRSAAQSVADALGKRAANAADTRVVQSFEELPEHIRQLYGEVSSRLEGVYDPASGTVYLVADNLRGTARAAEVWMHENMVHHGLNGLLGMDEKRRVLNRLWQSMDGMGNAGIASIARKYGVDPRSDVEGRALVMEEYLAHLAEKRAADKLSGQEQALWRRFVEAVLRAWHALTDAVTGRTGSMKYGNVDRLLSALDRYVFEGRPEGMAEGGMVPAMASVDRSGSDMEAAHAAWEQVQRDAEEWGRQVDGYMPGVKGRAGKDTTLLTVCRTPDVLQKLGAVDLPMTMTRDNLTKILSDKQDHALPKDLVKQLPQAVAEPIMVFESATQADAFVVLTELRHEGRSVMVAVHLDTERQHIRVNDIASAYKRGNEGWYVRQIEEGRLLYQDKKKSLAWARTARLQLPLVRKLPSRLSGKKILTEADVVKPIAPDNKPFASLRDVFGTTAKEEQRAEDAAPKTPLDSFRSKIGGHRPTVAERFAAFRENWKRKVEQQVFDHFASIKDVSKDGYVQARMTTSLGTQIESLIKYGAPVWNDGIMGVEGKSLTDVFAPVASEMDSFMGWMVANRAARLKKEGRENLFTDAEIAAARKLNEGVMPDGSKRAATYKQVFEDFARFKKAVLDFAQEGGIIDPESRSAWENADYIPFYRVKDGLDAVRSARNNSGLAGQSSGVKTLKGGKANIGDPVENIMRNFIHLIDAAQKNRAADMILQDMAKARLARKLTPEEVARLEKRQGDELTEVLAQDKELAAQCGPLTDSQKKVIAATFNPTEFNYVRVQKDGKSLYYSVEDPMLLDALTGMWKQDGRQGPVWKLLRGTRRLLTTGVTSMPDFMLRNFLRDTLHAWTIEHQSGYRPLVDSLAQIKNTFNVDEDTKQLLAAGSAFMGSGYRLGNSGEEAAKALNKVLDKYGMDKKAFQDSVLDTGEKLKAFVGKLREGYEHAGSAAENAARLAVYKKMRAKGFSHREAAFAAKDLMDFTVRGQSQLIQSLCETVPFLGARLAGLHRLGRGAVENPRAFAAKGMTIALASMALYALNQALNPDDWDKMEDWEKDTYFHFWVDGEHFRLPKPFEVGFIFGTIPERMMEQLITDKSGGVFASRVFAGIWDQLAFNPFPQAVRPLVEQVANKDFFRETPIVGMGMDRKAPVDQFDSRTSLTVRAMASFMDALLTPVMGKTGADVLRSPKRLEHLVNGYFGGLGAFVLGASDMVLRPLGNEPEAPERKLEELPIIRSFYGGSGEKRTRYESELYEVMKQGNKLHASLKQIAEEGGNVSAAKAELSHDDIVALANRKGLTALTKEFGKLNKAAEKVRINRVMSSSDKQRELDNIQRRKNILAQRAMKRVESMRAQ